MVKPRIGGLACKDVPNQLGHKQRTKIGYCARSYKGKGGFWDTPAHTENGGYPKDSTQSRAPVAFTHLWCRMCGDFEALALARWRIQKNVLPKDLHNLIVAAMEARKLRSKCHMSRCFDTERSHLSHRLQVWKVETVIACITHCDTDRHNCPVSQSLFADRQDPGIWELRSNLVCCIHVGFYVHKSCAAPFGTRWGMYFSFPSRSCVDPAQQQREEKQAEEEEMMKMGWHWSWVGIGPWAIGSNMKQPLKETQMALCRKQRRLN